LFVFILIIFTEPLFEMLASSATSRKQRVGAERKRDQKIRPVSLDFFLAFFLFLLLLCQCPKLRGTRYTNFHPILVNLKYNTESNNTELNHHKEPGKKSGENRENCEPN